MLRTPEFQPTTSYVFLILVLLIVLFLELVSCSRGPGIYCTTRRRYRHDLDTSSVYLETPYSSSVQRVFGARVAASRSLWEPKSL
jgi:hypothetical protein